MTVGGRRSRSRGAGGGKGGWSRGTDGAEAGLRRGIVLCWYLSVNVVGEKVLTRAGVRLVVQMRRIATGRSAGAYTEAVGIRCRREWCRHTIISKPSFIMK